MFLVFATTLCILSVLSRLILGKDLTIDRENKEPQESEVEPNISAKKLIKNGKFMSAVLSATLVSFFMGFIEPTLGLRLDESKINE